MEWLDITDHGLNQLLAMCGPGLKVLNAKNTWIRGEHVTVTCARLESLNLAGCMNVADAGLNVMLGKLGANLRCLNLGATEVSGADIEASCPHLENLRDGNIRVVVIV